MIRTVLSDISPKGLGWCQCHEHVFVANGPSRVVNEALYMDDYKKSLDEVKMYVKAGGKSFVDAQPFRCGRMAENLVKVSMESGANIIACTGFHKTIFFEDFDWLQQQSEETLADIYIKEIEMGMVASDQTKLMAKAGLIKCAAIKGEHTANKMYEKLFHAVTFAAKQTNAPVLVHMDEGADAISVFKFFQNNGIEPEKILFCHLDRTMCDFGYHKELASAGVYLEYDTIHRYKYHSDEQELDLIQHMFAHGFQDRILLGLDTTNQRLKSYGADFGLDDILVNFKQMMDVRLGSYAVDKLMIENPARALSFS